MSHLHFASLFTVLLKMWEMPPFMWTRYNGTFDQPITLFASGGKLDVLVLEELTHFWS